MLGAGITGRCNPEGSNYKVVTSSGCCSDQLGLMEYCMLSAQNPKVSFCVPIHLIYAIQDFFGVAASGSWQAIVRGAGHTQFLTAGEQTPLLNASSASVSAS